MARNHKGMNRLIQLTKRLAVMVLFCACEPVLGATQSTATRAMAIKLKKIIIPRVEFQDATSAEVAAFYNKVIKQRGQGMDVTIEIIDEPDSETALPPFSYSTSSVPLWVALERTADAWNMDIDADRISVTLSPRPPDESDRSSKSKAARNGAAGPGAIFDDRNVTIRQVNASDGSVALFADLANCLEATVMLSLTLTNATASCKSPLTVDAGGRKTFKLATVRQQNQALPWYYYYHFQWSVGARRVREPKPYVYSLPYTGATYRVTQGEFGEFSHTRGGSDEHAIDIAMPLKTTILAARPGRVVALREDSNSGGADRMYAGSANYVVIQHDDGTFAEYMHLARGGVKVKLGRKVKLREALALSGDTGWATEPHLHFSVFHNIDGKTQQTIPVQFKLPSGTVETLQEGQTY